MEKFDKAKVKNTETQEKNPLPSKGTIEHEKSAGESQWGERRRCVPWQSTRGPCLFSFLQLFSFIRHRSWVSLRTVLTLSGQRIRTAYNKGLPCLSQPYSGLTDREGKELTYWWRKKLGGRWWNKDNSWLSKAVQAVKRSSVTVTVPFVVAAIQTALIIGMHNF